MIRRLLSLKWRLLPLVAAALILSIPLAENVWTRHQISEAAQAAQLKLASGPKTLKLQGTPNRILIPSLNIDLPVVSQSYSPVLKSWPVSASTANYATETALINNFHGQSLIYGHDIRSVFEPLLGLQPKAVVYVYTDNGHVFKYTYAGSHDVSPRQTTIVADMADQPAGLNLITCDGAYFQYRHVMNFKLVKAV
jgi:sortase (surface protein transpeptidase)